MLTESQKAKLTSKIEALIRESIYENGFLENFFQEAGKKKHHHDDDDEDDEKPKKHKHHDEDEDSDAGEDISYKRTIVVKWLSSAQNLHSVLSYELFPELDKDSARSEFSKKYRQEDADGNPYDFTDDEINKLFNMRGRYIKRAGLDK